MTANQDPSEKALTNAAQESLFLADLFFEDFVALGNPQLGLSLNPSFMLQSYYLIFNTIAHRNKALRQTTQLV